MSIDDHRHYGRRVSKILLEPNRNRGRPCGELTHRIDEPHLTIPNTDLLTPAEPNPSGMCIKQYIVQRFSRQLIARVIEPFISWGYQPGSSSPYSASGPGGTVDPYSPSSQPARFYQ